MTTKQKRRREKRKRWARRLPPFDPFVITPVQWDEAFREALRSINWPALPPPTPEECQRARQRLIDSRPSIRTVVLCSRCEAWVPEGEAHTCAVAQEKDGE